MPRHPAAAWSPVSAKRVFLRVLPASGAGYYVVWNDSGAPNGESVVAERFSLDDVPAWPAPGRAIISDLSDPSLWDACPDDRGGVLVAAVERQRLTVQRVGPAGDILWKRPVVDSTVEAPVTSVVEIDDGDGGVILAWAQGGPDQSVVWAQRWNAAGQPQWSLPGARTAPTEARQTHPNILRDGQGSVLVAWRSNQGDLAKIRAQRFSAEGNRLWADRGIDVISPAGDLRQRILMAAPGDGGLVMAWSQGVAGVNRLYFQHVSADGTRTWSVAGVTQSGAIVEQWNPVLEGSGDGSVWIGWEAVQAGGAPKVMLSRRGPPRGALWAAGDVPLSDVNGSQGRLTLTLDGSDGVLAAWIDNRAGTGLYLQRVDGQGRLRFGHGWEVATGVRNPQQPHLVLAAPGRVAVVWLEEKGENLWDLKRRVVDFR